MEFWTICIGILLILFFVFFKSKKKPQVLLQGHKNWIKVTLIDVKTISHDSKTFVFDFANSEQELGLPLGTHVLFRATIPTLAHPEGEEIIRKYTPTSRYNVKGRMDCPIKIYYKNTHPLYPEGGIIR